jgi:hypothetical protein
MSAMLKMVRRIIQLDRLYIAAEAATTESQKHPRSKPKAAAAKKAWQKYHKLIKAHKP